MPSQAALRDAPQPLAPRELIFHNGLGGFTPDGREYVVTLQPGQTTPVPWVNVIANPTFGTVISESGCGYTWAENSHEFRLTPWNNDPVTDATGEAFYIRDEESGNFWSPTPLPAPGATPYVIRHGFGYSVFEHAREWHHFRVDRLCRHGCAGQILGLEIAECLGSSAPDIRNGLLGMGLGRPAPKNLLHVQTEVDRQDRCVTGPQFL